jgi:hypothetical protein
VKSQVSLFTEDNVEDIEGKWNNTSKIYDPNQVLCDTETQILINGGITCKTCEYSYPNENNTECISGVCTESEVYLMNGNCSSCGEYTHPDDGL